MVNVPVTVPVPKALVAPVIQPKLSGTANSSLVDYIIAMRAALDQANSQLAAIAGLK